MEDKLVILLKQETQILKDQYIQKIKEYAVLNFEICKKRIKYTDKDYCEMFGLEPIVVQYANGPGYTFPKTFYKGKLAKEVNKIRVETRSVYHLGLEKYTEKLVKSAHLHYESSIVKLVSRIRKKNLIEDNIIVKTSYIGRDIETILTDGIQTIKAQTIFAQGEHNIPHYRYLVK